MPRAFDDEPPPAWNGEQQNMMKKEGKPLEPLLNDQAGPPKYRDPYVLLFFLINTVASIGLGTYSTLTCDKECWNSITENPAGTDNGGMFTTPSPSFNAEDVKEYTKEGIIMVILAIIIGIVMGYASLKLAATQTRCLLYTGGAIQIAAIAFFWVLSRSFIFMIFGIIMIAFYAWLLTRKDSIEFAIWVVQTSCMVIQENRGVVRLVLFWELLTAIFVSGYFFITFGTYAKFTFAAIYLLFSTYWFTEVMNNILAVTISSLAADWAYGIGSIDSVNPVSSSWKHAMTYALGSICLGSLIVSFLKTLRVLARMLANSQSDNAAAAVIAICCMCFIGILENLMRLFNEWAYAYIGMYQKDFRTSASLVWNLFLTNGWEAIKNDIFTDLVTMVPPLMSGFLAAGVIALVSKFVFNWVGEGVLIASIVGGVLALMLVSMVMRIISTAQNVIFLSYLELRDRFYQKHPTVVADLEERFQRRYPDIQFAAMGGGAGGPAMAGTGV